MTLDEIRKFCHEDGDCLIWDGRTNAKGQPKYGRLLIRRTVAAITHGPHVGNEVTSVSCDNPLCVSPDHVFKTSKSEVTRKANARPGVFAKRVAANIRVNRHKMAKLTIEQVREIRASSEMGKVLAERYGVTPDAISKIRNNRCWRDDQNPFAGLFTSLAANDSKRRAA